MCAHSLVESGKVCFSKVEPWCCWEVQSFSSSSCGLENIWVWLEATLWTTLYYRETLIIGLLCICNVETPCWMCCSEHCRVHKVNFKMVTSCLYVYSRNEEEAPFLTRWFLLNQKMTTTWLSFLRYSGVEWNKIQNRTRLAQTWSTLGLFRSCSQYMGIVPQG